MPLTEEWKQKLSQLQAEYPSADSQEYIANLQKEVETLLEEQESLNLPVFKRFTERAEKKTNELNALLMNDDALLNDKGLAIARERDMWRTILSAFGLIERDNALRELAKLVESKMPNKS